MIKCIHKTLKGGYNMKVLIVEDLESKRKQLTDFLTKEAIEFEICEYVKDALRYIYFNKENISGIILDLGLQWAIDDNDYAEDNGLDIVYELDRINLNIPILINSITLVDVLDKYPFVYGQRTVMESYEMLEKFITFLKEKEEQ